MKAKDKECLELATHIKSFLEYDAGNFMGIDLHEAGLKFFNLLNDRAKRFNPSAESIHFEYKRR